MILAPIHFVGEHYDAMTEARWCSCVPQNVIDRHNEWCRAFITERLDINKPDDEKAWEAAHYGRHDRNSLGLSAVVFPVPQIIADDRVPQGWIIGPSVLWDLLGGRHRDEPLKPEAVVYSTFFHPGQFVRPDAHGNRDDPICCARLSDGAIDIED